ncbi:MAG: hypothetical protein OCD00_14995 [Colwellia sp.]
MQLEKHIVQGSLLYLSRNDNALSVCENEHYRWLAFSTVIQSVMHKRKPWQLTLPHQTALLLPLLFFKPDNIVELGLGGGNIARFLTHLSKKISVESIENNAQVIECFKQYFNPENTLINIVNKDSEQWLSQQQSTNIDWLICDIYKQESPSANYTMKQLELLTDKINDHACLSINLPDSSDNDINLYLTVLQQLQSNHDIVYFHVPNYLNIIIHLIPKHWRTTRLLKRNKSSYLSRHTFLRWRNFWQHGKGVYC